MKAKIVLSAVLIAIGLTACKEETTTQVVQNKTPEYGKIYSAQLKELTDEDYPDNPDISICSELNGTFSHGEITIIRTDSIHFDLNISANNKQSSPISLSNIELLEWIPVVPPGIDKDAYLKRVCLVNQEWNRQQVRLGREYFVFGGDSTLESGKLIRIDLARNCLNSYLWELIFYDEEKGTQKPIYHAWFDFPKELYAELMEERAHIDMKDWEKPLVTFEPTLSDKIDLNKFRKASTSTIAKFEVLNDQLYPLIGERKKKHKNIIYPKPESITSINDLLTDSTTFATFTPPGYYNTQDPRKTQLSRLAQLDKVIINEVVSTIDHKQYHEFVLSFSRKGSEEGMGFVIGGINLAELPALSIDQMAKGWQKPMGISVHSFYEDYQYAIDHNSLHNPYYGLLLDTEGKWLDSHEVGIDGPLLYRDADNPNKIHIWVLSFERHAFVGHYVVELAMQA